MMKILPTLNLICCWETMTTRPFTYFVFSILSLLLIGNTAFSQQTDLRLRLFGELEKEIVKDLNMSLEYEHRFNKNLTAFDKAFFEPSLSYDFNKQYRIGASCRMGLSDNDVRKRKYQYRTSAYLQYRFKVDDFRIRFRTVLQYGFDDISSISSFLVNNLVNRNSVQVDYDWFGSRLRPYAKYEFFFLVNHPQGGIINQQRFSAGTKYKVSKALSLNAFYMFENEFNIVSPINSHIFGFGASYSL